MNYHFNIYNDQILIYWLAVHIRIKVVVQYPKINALTDS